MRDLKGIMAFCCLMIAVGFILIDVFRNPYAQIVTILLPMAVIVLNVHHLWGDWFPIRRGPQINTLSGISGTQIGQPILEYGGFETRRVAFPRDLIHPEIRKQREKGMAWFWDFMSGVYTLEIQAKSWQWVEIPQEDNENPNGCILYLGRLDGGDLKNPDIIVPVKQLERQSAIISYVFTAMAKLEEQVANIANVKNLDAEQMAQHLQYLSDKVKQVKIITKQGASGSEVSEIGAAMG